MQSTCAMYKTNCPICAKEIEIKSFGQHLRECNQSNGCAVTKVGTQWYCKLHEVSFDKISEHIKQKLGSGGENSNDIEKVATNADSQSSELPIESPEPTEESPLRRSERSAKQPKRYQDFTSNEDESKSKDKNRAMSEECPKCKRKLLNAKSFNRHTQVCFKTCYRCQWMFKDAIAYKKHNEIFHSKPRESEEKRTCSKCQKKFWPSTIVDHMQVCKKTCYDCKKIFRDLTECQKHMKIKHKIKARGSGTKSSKRTRENESPLRQSKRVRKDPEVYRIDDDDDENNEVVTIADKVSIAENEVSKLYKCPICKKKFLTQEITIKHIESFHQFPQETQIEMGLKIHVESV